MIEFPQQSNRLERAPAATGLGFAALLVCVAALYFLAARASVIFEIPPGRLQPVWIPTGLAMASVLVFGARVAPGVWLGSFAHFSFSLVFVLDLPWSQKSAFVAVLLATGATLQALFARYLLARSLGLGRRIDTGWLGLKLCLLAGPVACLLSAPITIAVMLAADYLPGKFGVPAVIVIWVADVVGALLVVPIAWAWLTNPPAVRVRRTLSVAVSVSGLALIVLGVFAIVRSQETNRRVQTFQDLTTAVSKQLAMSAGSGMDRLQDIVEFFDASDDVTPDEFCRFTEPLLARNGGIEGVDWVPRVTAEERAAFSREASARLGMPYEILEIDTAGVIRRETERAEYFPVYYSAPHTAQGTDMGLDVARCKTMARALEQARQEVRPIATEPMQLEPGTAVSQTILVYAPVFDMSRTRTSAPDGLMGFVSGLFSARALVETGLAGVDLKGVHLSIDDCTEGTKRVYDPGSFPAAPTGLPISMPLVDSKSGEIAGRQWRVTLRATHEYLADSQRWLAWLLFVLGLAGCGMLGVYQGLVAGRAAHIEDLVAARTKELSIANSALQRVSVEARAAATSKSEFLANMSHEIRTPMMAILGFTELLSNPTAAEAERHGWVETVRRNGHHLLALINDILDLSRIEAGQISIERIPCSPVAILASVVATFSKAAQDKGLELSIEFASPVPEMIESDPTRVRQVLVNLVGNAVKFTERGSVRVHIGVDGRGRLAIRVQDTGPGLSSDQMARVFDSFTQGDSSTTRRFGGTGLGLSISRQLARLLGGDLTVESQLGVGSTFTCTIELGTLLGVQLVDTIEPPSIAPAPKEGESESRINARVLVVDDNHDTQLLLSSILARAEVDFSLAENGRQAMDVVLRAEGADGAFGLVLLDIQMPGIDGYQVAETLRREGFQGAILALTAHAMAADKERCLDAGCDGHLTKPFDRRALLAACERVLAVRRAARIAHVRASATDSRGGTRAT